MKCTTSALSTGSGMVVVYYRGGFVIVARPATVRLLAKALGVSTKELMA